MKLRVPFSVGALWVALTMPMLANSAIKSAPDFSISSITAVSSIEKGAALSSGVFVSYSNIGRVEFFTTEERGPGYDETFEVVNTLEFGHPTAIAEMRGILYVWDAEEHGLLAVDTESGHIRMLAQGGPLGAPSHIVVSPLRFVIVVDEETGGVFWVQDNGRENETFRRTDAFSNIQHFASAAFLSWDTAVVLDGATGAIHVYEVRAFEEGIRAHERSEMPLALRHGVGEFTALTAQEGTLYISTRDRIYSYVIEQGELVPATPPSSFSDIRQIAASADDLFVLDGQELKPTPKTIPVEFDLDVEAFKGQAALLQVYLFLDKEGLLPVRQLRAQRAYPALEELLVESNVLLAPLSTLIELVPDRGWFVFQQKGPPASALGRDTADFAVWFCEHNNHLCTSTPPDEVFFMPISIGASLTVPALEVQSRLRRKEVDLDGVSVEAMLEQLVFSPDKKEKIDVKLLRRFNKEYASLPEKKLYSLRKGSVSLPYESWSVTVSVPAAQYRDAKSELWAIARTGDVGLFSHEVYTDPAGYSGLPPPPDDSADACEVLKQGLSQLRTVIKYPDSTITSPELPTLEEIEVYVGILEQAGQTDDEHLVFQRDSDTNQAWHEVVDFDLVTKSIPQSWQTPEPVSVGQFNRNNHHGAHVAALIGGTKTECWSGMLPNSKLVLIDVSSKASINNKLHEAKSARVGVFNVSQRLATAAEASFLGQLQEWMLEALSDSLFVVSAGNDGKDLNSWPAPPFPAAWGDKANVITVTAFDDKQKLIGSYTDGDVEFKGANTGKKLVDLVTVGEDVMSATSKNHFALATGTSQAAPLVAAAAAYLVDSNQGADQTPGEVKARLIATADWNSDHKDAVWGGMFNFGDAVRFHDRNILQTITGGEDRIYSIDPRRAQLEIAFGGLYHERSGPRKVTREGPILQDWIISLRLQGGDPPLFRMVYRDPETDELKIILDAQLSGKLKCRKMEEYDEETQEFKEVDGGCSGGIDVRQVKEYITKMPYRVKW